MKTYRKFRTAAAVMAAVLLICSVPTAFADGKNTSKGASVISAAAAAAGQTASANDSAQSADDTGDSHTSPATATDSASADQTASGIAEDDSADEPDISLGDEFTTDLSAAEEKALNSIEYSLDEYENNEVLVMYNDGSLEVKKYDSQDDLKAGLEALDADESVDTYQPNFSYENEAVTQTITNDSYAKAQWALSNNGTFKGYRTSLKSKSGVDVSAEKAWRYYTPARQAVIALIDTGVQYRHSELTGSFWTNTDEIAGNGVDDDGNGYVDDINGWNFYDNNNYVYTGSTDAHGTHCAGTISAKKNNEEGVAGLADYDNIKIMMLKALGGEKGEGTTLSLALAIKYAEANGASICNLSLGTDTNDKVLYRTMKNSKMLFIVAAGNGGEDGRGIDIDKKPSYPASYDLDNIITVANIKADGTLSASSDYGASSVDIGAPGTDIISTSAGGKYAYMTGTSMAAPFVTAAAAMVYSSNADLTLADTKNILLSTVKTDTALSGKTVSGGILDCGSAVAYAVTGSTQSDGDDESISSQPSSDSSKNDGNDRNGGQSQQRPSQGGTETPSNGIRPGYDFSGDPFGSNANDPFGSGRFSSIGMPMLDLSDLFGFRFRIEVPHFVQIIMSGR